MKAVITVIGKDRPGIIATVSGALFEYNANILDISQTIMQDMFTMIMLIDIGDISSNFAGLSASLEELGNEIGMKIHVMHEDIFNSMHRI